MAQQNSETAAVAHEAIAEIMGLKVIKRNIQDMQDNITRFLVLGRDKPAATGNDRTSIIFWTNNRPGALFKILEAFAATRDKFIQDRIQAGQRICPVEICLFCGSGRSSG